MSQGGRDQHQQNYQQASDNGLSKTKVTFRTTKKDDIKLLPHEVFDSMEELQSMKSKYPSIKQTYRVKPNSTMNRSISSNFFSSNKPTNPLLRSKYDLNAHFKVNTDRWYSGLEETKTLSRNNESLQEINTKSSRNLTVRHSDKHEDHQHQQSMPYQLNATTSEGLFKQLPRSLQSAINLPNLYSQVEENERMINPLRSEQQLLNPFNSNHNKSRQSSLTNLNFKIKKLHNTYYNSSQRSLIEPNQEKDSPFTYVDFFQQGDMIHIKISNLTNFKIEPLEKFDEGRLYDEDPSVQLNSGVFRGFSKWQEPDGTFIWKDCLVKDYNPITAKFTIQWIANKKMKEVSRLNLMYEHESQEIADNRYRLAKEKREQMLYFISLKQKIGETSTDSKEILFRKKNLMRILDLVFNTDFLKEVEDDWKQQVISDILQAYKFDVVKFVYQANTVQSLHELFSTYYPEELLRKRLKRYNLQLNLEHIDEYVNEVQIGEQNKDDQRGKKKYQNSFFIPERIKEEENEQQLFEFDYNIHNWVYDSHYLPIESDANQTTFATSLDGQTLSKISRPVQRKITLSSINIQAKNFIQYAVTNLSKNLRFHYDPKFIQLHSTLPQVKLTNILSLFPQYPFYFFLKTYKFSYNFQFINSA